MNDESHCNKVMYQLPYEIIEKIAFLLIEKKKWHNDAKYIVLLRRMHVLTPIIIEKKSILDIVNLSSCSKFFYNILNSHYFWKTVVNKHFATIKQFVENDDYKYLIKQGTTISEKQCKSCRYFHTYTTHNDPYQCYTICSICRYHLLSKVTD